MYHCNLARTPALPLFSRVSGRPRCSKPLSTFNYRSTSPIPHHKPLNHVHELNPSTQCSQTSGSRFCSKTLAKPRYFSTRFRGKLLENITSREIRAFTRSLHQGVVEDDGARAVRKSLPWIQASAGREGKGAEKKNAEIATKTGRSPWEASAESYFSRNAGMSSREKTDSRVEAADKEEREESGNESESVDNPRWNKIKSKYKAFVDRESRFEKPEVHKWNKQENWGRKTWKEATESLVPTMVGQGVYGVGPVLAALSIARREFYALYVQEGLNFSGNIKKKKDKKAVEKVLRIAEKIGLKVVQTSKHDLNMVVDNRPHQGLVLDASPLEMVNVKELDPPSREGRKSPLWVALDEVTDPQNLGAIIRSAYYFGAEGLVMCAKNSAPLSGVVSKASAGSLELIELMYCKNMMQFLSLSVDNGWRVLGGSVSSRAIPLSEVEVGVPTILVLGSEGKGLRPLVERSCTELIRIPGAFPTDGNAGEDEADALEMEQSYSGQELKTFLAVESLNVSVAAGVLLYHLVGKNDHLVGEETSGAFE